MTSGFNTPESLGGIGGYSYPPRSTVKYIEIYLGQLHFAHSNKSTAEEHPQEESPDPSLL